MAGELYTAIRAITGSVASGTPATTDAQLLIFLNQASKFVIHNLPIEYATPFWTDSSAITSSAGHTVVTDRIVHVRRNGRACKQVGFGLAYAQDLTPAFSITVSDYANIAVGYAITINGVKLYCQASATAERSDFIKETSNAATAQNIVDAITNTFSAPVSASLSTATVTITGAVSVTSQDATRLTVTQSATSTSLYKATELFPVYYTMANKAYIKPDPTASAIGYVTYVAPITFTAGDDSEVTVSGVKTIIIDYAVYLDFVHLSGVWRDLAQTELAKATVATTGYLALFTTALPTWADVSSPVMPVLALTGAPDFSEIDLSAVPIPNSLISFTSAGSAPSSTITLTKSLPTFNMPVNEVDMSNFNTYMGTSIDDTEKAQLDIQKQSALINKFQADFTGEAQRFTNDVNNYRAELENKVQELTLGINAYQAKLQDNSSQLNRDIQQFVNEINNYNAQGNIKVQKWTAEKVQFILNKWINQNQSEINEFSGRSGSVINEYSALITNQTQKVSAGLNKAMSYLQQAATVINIANVYLAKSQASFNNSIKFKEYAIDGIKFYISKLQENQQ